MGCLYLRNGYVTWNVSAGHCPAQIGPALEVSMASGNLFLFCSVLGAVSEIRYKPVLMQYSQRRKNAPDLDGCARG